MPNHIKNHLRIQAPEALKAEIWSAISGDEEGMLIDFEKIIPHVNTMPVPEGQCGYTSNDIRHARSLGLLDELTYNRRHWPDAVFRVDYADEDIESNCGILVFHGDEMEEHEPYYAVAFALELHGLDPRASDLDDGYTKSRWIP